MTGPCESVDRATLADMGPRACAWWRLRRHSWSIIKTHPHAISLDPQIYPTANTVTTFAWESCDRCGAGRVHEFPGRWLDQYPLWEDA